MYSIVNISDSIPRHPTMKWKTRGKITRIVVHMTGSDNQSPIKTARYHVTPGPGNHINKKGCPSLCYHDYIVKEGIVYHCNDYEFSTWHAGFYNKSSIGVVMAYGGNDFPPILQYDAMIQHVVYLALKFKVLPKNILGHREVPGMYTILGKGSVKYKKWCPGKAIDLVGMRKEIAMRMQRVLGSKGLYNGIIDGLFGKQSKAALEAYRE